jgi:hypothetical protein
MIMRTTLARHAAVGPMCFFLPRTCNAGGGGGGELEKFHAA